MKGLFNSFTIIILAATFASSKEKLLALIKKLERITDGLKFGPSVEKEAISAKAPEEAKPLNLDEKREISSSIRDPNKSYCDEATECPAGPLCSDKEIIYFGNLRKSYPLPVLTSVCDARMYISELTKSYSAGEVGCCGYNGTHTSFHSDRIWKCGLDVLKNSKKSIPAAGMKSWTSGRFSTACGKYIWCPDKEIFTDVKWKRGYPKAGAGDCVAINIGSKNPEDDGLYNHKCDGILISFCTIPAIAI